MTEPRCTKCGALKRVRVRSVATGGISRTLYCPCSHRATAAAWIARNPEKRAAHKAVERAIDRGTLQRQPCTVCGSAEAEAHHDDYAAPLDVTWLCRMHHAKRHRGAP